MSRRLWGGSQLAGYLGIEEGGVEETGSERSGIAEGGGEPTGTERGRPTEAPGAEPLAEAWQVFEENQVRNGVFSGRSLAAVAAEMGAWLLGTASISRYGNKVPLLAKFIDAAKPLSIQVHPDDEYARRHEAASGHLGKAEAWYILACHPEAHIIWGFDRDMTEEQVRSAVEAGELERYVNRIPVAPGDVIYNPEGTVHAIGADIFLFEIQQASDLTYRLYDYRRRDANGRLRELHLDRALEVSNLRAGRQAKVAPLELGEGRRLLVESRHFGMEAVEPDGRLQLATSPASLDILTVTRGRVALKSGTGVLELDAGTSAVLPAALGEYSLEGKAQVLRCYVPVA